MRHDLFRYLIMSEGGATAFLATAIARQDSGVASPYHQAIWMALAEQFGITLSATGPHKVLVEAGNLDLVLLWDEWCIVIEVKIRSGSVTQGQLQEYYDLLRNGPDVLSARFPGTVKLALVFLTPRQIGKEEFESLVVNEPDIKLHLPWEGVLVSINAAIDVSEQKGFIEEFLSAGTTRIAGLLREIKSRSPLEVTEEKRLARRQFAKDVQTFVTLQRPEWARLFRPLWTAPSVEEIYLSLDETRRVNMYFTIFADSVVTSDELGSSTVALRWWLKVANNRRRELGIAFSKIDRAAVAQQLRLPEELADKVEFDSTKLTVILRTNLVGARSQLISQCAAILERFVETFQTLLA